MKRILFVQFGDFKEAYLRLRDGGAETYRNQKRTVDWVASLASGAICTTLAIGRHTYKDQLAENLWTIGIERQALNRRMIRALFDDVQPTHVVLRTPNRDVLREARLRSISILPCFADMFRRGGPRTTLGNALLRRELRMARAPCFTNHNLNASKSIVDVLKLPAKRVVPWDWQHAPITATAKHSPADSANPTAFFAGMISESKGVKDCLLAVAELAKTGVFLRMTFAGPGDINMWKNLSATLGISGQVKFVGLIANSEVQAAMNSHDFVIVPSRHDYPEGLPNTIYEGLTSRSALIISDHPAFEGRLVNHQDALIFEAGNATALATCIAGVLKDNSVYKRLSQNAQHARDRLYLGLEWVDLVTAFLNDPDDQNGWVARNNIAAAMQAADIYGA